VCLRVCLHVCLRVCVPVPIPMSASMFALCLCLRQCLFVRCVGVFDVFLCLCVSGDSETRSRRRKEGH